MSRTKLTCIYHEKIAHKLGKNFKQKRLTFLQEQDSESLVKREKESESEKVKAKETSGKRFCNASSGRQPGKGRERAS